MRRAAAAATSCCSSCAGRAKVKAAHARPPRSGGALRGRGGRVTTTRTRRTAAAAGRDHRWDPALGTGAHQDVLRTERFSAPTPEEVQGLSADAPLALVVSMLRRCQRFARWRDCLHILYTSRNINPDCVMTTSHVLLESQRLREAHSLLRFAQSRGMEVPQRVINAATRACAATRNERDTGREEIEELLVEFEAGPASPERVAPGATTSGGAGRRGRAGQRGRREPAGWRAPSAGGGDGGIIICEGPGSTGERSVLAAAARGAARAPRRRGAPPGGAGRARVSSDRRGGGPVWEDTLFSLLLTIDQKQEARPSNDCWSHEVRTTRLSIPDIGGGGREEDEENREDDGVEGVFEDAVLLDDVDSHPL